MALDFQQVYQKIQEIGASVKQRKKALDDRRALARQLLNLNADNIAGLRNKVGQASEIEQNLRCALPVAERLDFHAPAPAMPPNATLIAADGSQINPDRHGPVLYGLVNVGAIILRLNSGEAPVIRTESQLLFDEELYTSSGNPMSDGMMALRRDLQERTKLHALAVEFGGNGFPVITFTDGPIELWGVKDGEDASAFEESLNKYLSVLSKLQNSGVTTAGYVDKPAADLLVRLLEVSMAGADDLEKLREFHPLRGVSDRWLFGDRTNPLLQPGERSAVFAFHSKSEKHYKGGLALHFFYLNAGTENHPWPVRVEIPKWVADDSARLDMLHAVLVNQCRILGYKPYPYLLHRAHETAVVSHKEKLQVDQMLQQELQRSGGEVEDGSNKQSIKDSAPRSSYR